MNKKGNLAIIQTLSVDLQSIKYNFKPTTKSFSCPFIHRQETVCEKNSKKMGKSFGGLEFCSTFALANRKQRHLNAEWRDSSAG